MADLRRPNKENVCGGRYDTQVFRRHWCNYDHDDGLLDLSKKIVIVNIDNVHWKMLLSMFLSS